MSTNIIDENQTGNNLVAAGTRRNDRGDFKKNISDESNDFEELEPQIVKRKKTKTKSAGLDLPNELRQILFEGKDEAKGNYDQAQPAAGKDEFSLLSVRIPKKKSKRNAPGSKGESSPRSRDGLSPKSTVMVNVRGSDDEMFPDQHESAPTDEMAESKTIDETRITFGDDEFMSYPQSYYDSIRLSASVDAVRQFSTSSLGTPGSTVRALLTRHKTMGIMAEYKIHLENSIGQPTNHPPIQAKKGNFFKAPFFIGMSKVDFDLPRWGRGEGFIAKLSLRKDGQYVLYDAGCDPDDLLEINPYDEKEESSTSDDDPSSVFIPRKELAGIIFRDGQMEVGIPKVTYNPARNETTTEIWQPNQKNKQLLNNFRAICSQNLQNDLMGDRLQCYITSNVEPMVGHRDYQGRVIQESVKNFQMVLNTPHRDRSGAVLLQMYKIKTDCWSVEFQYPLTLLQAFGICLTRFDVRL